MNRTLLVLVALVLVGPAAAAGPWTQPRGDAAQTGFQPEEGPAWPDVALRAQLPGNIRAEADAPPLVVDDRVLILARGDFDEFDGMYDVLEIDVDTGNVSQVGEVGLAGRLTMATDGTTVYVAGQRSVHALPLEPGGHNWTWTWEPRTGATRWEVGCMQIALGEGSLTVLCYEHDAEETDDETGEDRVEVNANTADVALVARLDAATGAERWTWERPDPPDQQDPQSNRVFPIGMAVSGSRVVVQTIEAVAAEGFGSGQGNGFYAAKGQGRIAVWAIDADGDPSWPEPWLSRTINFTAVPTPAGDPAGIQKFPEVIVGPPAASEDRVYVKVDALRELNLGTGEEHWSEPIGEEDYDRSLGGGTALALAEGHVYTATAQTVYRRDVESPKSGWSANLDLEANQGFDEDPIVTRSRLYAAALSRDRPGTIYAFDIGNGAVHWQQPVDHGLSSFSVGEGLLAYTDVNFYDDDGDGYSDGVNTTLVVLGRTDASPEPAVEVSSEYPAPGEEVRVDLSGSKAGLDGPVTRYKAYWGDGNETAWQDDPVLAHTYNVTGDRTARFVVGNANQTASTTSTFHVGQTPPREPTFLQEAFAPEHQDLTFGVIGIALALGGGAVGVTRRYRKRARLEEELDTLEAGFEETRDNPGECEAFLETRKARARSLLLDGDLTEEQFGVVERRVDELKRELRTGILDDRLQFLPYGMVQSIKGMLADGKISTWERATIEDLLKDDDTLNEAQRERVRGLLERWSEGGAEQG